MPLAFHLIQRLADNRVLVRSAAARRTYARTVLELGEDAGLICFGLPDNHSHVGVECDRAAAGRFAQGLGCALRARLDLPVPFSPLHVVPIVDAAHLRNAFFYMLTQAEHHGVEGDPYLEATSLPDLLGLRVGGGFVRARVRSLLPRVRRSDLLDVYGIDDLVPGVCLDTLAEAATSAVILPDLVGRTPLQVAARTAAIHIARGAGRTTTDIASLFALTDRAVRFHLTRVPDDAIVRAISLQLDLRHRLPADLVPFGRKTRS